MLQLVAQLVPVVMTGLIAYLLFRLGAALKHSGACLSEELGWMLPKTPALDAFLMFVAGTALYVVNVACAMAQVSNHIILSLDILYLISMLLLVLFHTFKEFGSLHVVKG